LGGRRIAHWRRGRLLLAEGEALAGGGIGITLTLACALLMESALFGLTPSDPAAIGAATVLMTAVALFADWLPARRATRIDPMIALRYE
jgi:ABC-type antimicrobial peptide transport system permease subunit